MKACYRLEGNGALAFECYEVVDQVLSSIAVENIPDVITVTQVLSGGQPPPNPVHQQCVANARCYVQGGQDYLKKIN